MNRTVYAESSLLIPDDALSLMDKIPGVWEIFCGTQFMNQLFSKLKNKKSISALKN